VITPETPVRFLKGVGASRAKTLEEYGLTTAHDLLWFFPFRYEDRRHPTHIADLGHHLDEAVLVRGRIISAHSKLSPVKRMKIFEAVLEDETGAVKLVWFNQPFLHDIFRPHQRVILFGKLELTSHGLQMQGPQYELVEGIEAHEGIEGDE